LHSNKGCIQTSMSAEGKSTYVAQRSACTPVHAQVLCMRKCKHSNACASVSIPAYICKRWYTHT
jgi:hypothetical protein